MTVKMAVHFCKTWLLVVPMLMSQVPAQEDLCGKDGTFHRHTGSCMQLILSGGTYLDSEHICSLVSSSGHLVFIFDKETDDFVKDLLAAAKVPHALIGLNDKAKSGVYVWSDGGRQRIPANYTGWIHKPHLPDNPNTKIAVVITKDGWKEFDISTLTYFVCQYNAVQSIPRIDCQVAEDGTSSRPVVCLVDQQDNVTSLSVSFYRNNEQVASCQAGKCQSNTGYKAENTTKFSWLLEIENVSTSDEVDWTCAVQSNKNSPQVTSESCRVKVYKKPTQIECNHTFVQSEMEVTCFVRKVYPRATCTWDVFPRLYQVSVYETKRATAESTSDNNYNDTKCTALVDVSVAGNYTVTVSAAPEVPGNVTVPAAVRENLHVVVAAPEKPPQLYFGEKLLVSHWLDITENEENTITCRAPGGNPPVYRTVIECDRIPGTYESQGSSVAMTLRGSPTIHDGSCTCRAEQAVSSYREDTFVHIRVRSSTAALGEINVVAIVTGAAVVGVVLAIVIVVALVVAWRRRRQGAYCSARIEGKWAGWSVSQDDSEPGNPHSNILHIDLLADEMKRNNELTEMPPSVSLSCGAQISDADQETVTK